MTWSQVIEAARHIPACRSLSVLEETQWVMSVLWIRPMVKCYWMVTYVWFLDCLFHLKLASNQQLTTTRLWSKASTPWNLSNLRSSSHVLSKTHSLAIVGRRVFSSNKGDRWPPRFSGVSSCWPPGSDPNQRFWNSSADGEWTRGASMNLKNTNSFVQNRMEGWLNGCLIQKTCVVAEWPNREKWLEYTGLNMTSVVVLGSL